MFRDFFAYLGLTYSPAESKPHMVSASESYYNHERPEIIEMIPRDVTAVLDVGCAAGAFGAALKKRLPHARVAGIECAQAPTQAAKQRLDEVFQLNLNELAEGQIPGSYDVIVCADVLEHLLDPENVLRVLADHLMPGGVLILSIPNVRHWSVLAPLLVNDLFTYTDEGLLDRTHVHLFTYTEINQMLVRTGWKEIDVRCVQIEMPARLDGLIQLAISLGAEPAQTRRLMNTFQFLLAAVR